MEPLGALKNPPEALSQFPAHRRRHLKSDTYSTLLRFLSLCPQSGGNNDGLGRTSEVRVDGIEITGSQIVATSCAEVVNVADVSNEDRIETNEADPGNRINKELVLEKGAENNELGRKGEVRVDADGITIKVSDMLSFSGDASCVKDVNVVESLNEDRMETNEVDLGNKINKTLVLEKGSASNELEQATEMCGVAYSTANMESEILSINGNASCSQVMNVVQAAHKDRMKVDGLDSVKGRNKELGEETGFRIVNSLEETNPESCVVSLTTTDGSQNSLVETLFNDSEIVRHADVDKEEHSCKLAKGFHSSLDMGETAKSPMFDGNEKVKGSVRESSELQQADLENPLSNFGLMNSPLCVAVDEESEEGEISGDLVMDDELIDFLNEEEQTSGLIVNKEQRTIQNQKGTSEMENKYDKVFGITVDELGKGVDSNLRENNVSKLAHGHEMVREIVSYQNLVDSDITYRGSFSTDKDDGVEKKRKRAPLTQEKRAKKKKRERIKRAEKNRQLGVKRLKIQPVSKPKTIQYCRHYLNGRCQEGDKCKFSHDTTPLTKSKPCCHFARNACQRPDCQYDHQLSKYPCNNFVSSGKCDRGTECLFSHEVKATEGSPSGVNASSSEANSSSLSWVANPEKKMCLYNSSNEKVDSKIVSSAVSSKKSAQQKITEIRLRAAASAPEGINKLLFGKSPLGIESKLDQAGTYSKIDGNEQINLPVVGNNNTTNIISNLNGTPIVPGCNEPKGLSFLSKQAMSLKTNQNKEKESETPKRNPSMPPRGINFLSIGKSSPVNNSSNIATSSADNGASSSSREGEIGQNPTGQLGKGASSSAWKALLTNGTSSAQKALQATLAFAAKYESKYKG